MAKYAFSDLHGRIDLFKKICDFINPEDELYCLGDCNDKGQNSWITIKAVLSCPQVKVYLKGNHEDMLVRAYENFIKFDNYIDKYYMTDYNGGLHTFYDLLMDDNANKWIAKIKNLPITFSLHNKKGDNIILSHAGYTPNQNTIPSPFKLLWDRNHFHDKWPKGFDNTTIIHGHTPIHFLQEENITIDFNNLSYCDGHKINIDLGTYVTEMVALINLDTYQIHIITSDNLK